MHVRPNLKVVCSNEKTLGRPNDDEEDIDNPWYPAADPAAVPEDIARE